MARLLGLLLLAALAITSPAAAVAAFAFDHDDPAGDVRNVSTAPGQEQPAGVDLRLVSSRVDAGHVLVEWSLDGRPASTRHLWSFFANVDSDGDGAKDWELVWTREAGASSIYAHGDSRTLGRKFAATGEVTATGVAMRIPVSAVDGARAWRLVDATATASTDDGAFFQDELVVHTASIDPRAPGPALPAALAALAAAAAARKRSVHA